MKSVILIVSCAGVVQSFAGDFVNLDFDTVRTDKLTPFIQPYYLGLVADLLPGWSVETGFPYRETTSIVYCDDPTRIAADSGVGVAPSIGGVGYSIELDPTGFGTGTIPVRMSQTATVPVWAKVLEFDGLSNSTLVSVNGRETYVLRGEAVLDVSGYAGSTITLVLRSDIGSFRLDGMRFTAVPEPSVGILSLVTIGGMMMFWIVRKSVSAR